MALPQPKPKKFPFRLLILLLLGLLAFSWLGVRTLRPLASSPESFSILIAGRDRLYSDTVSSGAEGLNTDTIFYANLTHDTLQLIAIPRDTYISKYDRRVNAVYALEGPTGLSQAVADLLGVSIDHYAIINLDIFKKLIDAVGGVELNVPVRMLYRDSAAGLHIDLQPGWQHLDGDEASQFIRYRGAKGADYSRVDNVKTLLRAFLERLRELRIGALFKGPELIRAFASEIESNVPSPLALSLLPKLNALNIQSATLPTYELSGSTALYTDPDAVVHFIEAFTNELSTQPTKRIMISNQSCQEGIEALLKAKLIERGIAKDSIVTRVLSPSPERNQLRTLSSALDSAAYYSELFRLSYTQVYDLDLQTNLNTELELRIGSNVSHFKTLIGEQAGADCPPPN